MDYAFQDINDIPSTLLEGRTKPWETGQAVLAAKKILNTPFVVINADDYYGKEGFKAVHEYLVNSEQKLTTECIENVIMMVPFTSIVMWTFQKKILNFSMRIIAKS